MANATAPIKSLSIAVAQWVYSATGNVGKRDAQRRVLLHADRPRLDGNSSATLELEGFALSEMQPRCRPFTFKPEAA